MKRNTILIPAALMMALPAAAQERLDESVAVDGRYKTEVVRMERITSFPAPVRFSLHSEALPYEERGVAANFAPILMAMPATGWRADRPLPTSRGYVDLAAGSWLNSSLSAGYRILASGPTTLGVRLQHNSTSLWNPELAPGVKGSERYVYDETLGADMAHEFAGTGRLSASLQYRVRCFNYYATLPYTAGSEDFKAPTQTLNDVAARIAWTPETRDGALRWNLAFAYRHFGYRALYSPAEHGGMTSGKGARENHLQLASELALPAIDGSREWNMGILADALVYGGEKWVQSPGSYGRIELTPGCRGASGPWAWRLGVKADLTFGARSREKRFSFFHIAPDVSVSLTSGIIGVYASAGGGKRLQTLAAQSVEDPYGAPAVRSSRPIYSPLDATLGVLLRPFAGFRIGVEGGYKIENNVQLGGWYQSELDMASGVTPVLPGTPRAVDPMANALGIRLHGGRVGLTFGYDNSPLVALRGSLFWQPQKGKAGWFDGYDRPRYRGRFDIAVAPVSPLRIEAGVDWRGGRAVYTCTAPDWRDIYEQVPGGSGVIINGGEDGRVEYPLTSVRLRDMVNLHLGASWNVTDAFSVRLGAENLLNRRVEALPLLPAEGICVSGGLSFEF